MPLIMMTRRRDNENVGKAERRLIKARVSRGTEHRAVIVLNIRYLLRLNTLRMRMSLKSAQMLSRYNLQLIKFVLIPRRPTATVMYDITKPN